MLAESEDVLAMSIKSPWSLRVIVKDVWGGIEADGRGCYACEQSSYL